MARKEVGYEKIFALLLSLSLLFTLKACSSTETASTDIDTDTEWVVYWYLCGSDLETNYASATNDLA